MTVVVVGPLRELVPTAEREAQVHFRNLSQHRRCIDRCSILVLVRRGVRLLRATGRNRPEQEQEGGPALHSDTQIRQRGAKKRSCAVPLLYVQLV